MTDTRQSLWKEIGHLERLLEDDDNWRALAALESVGQAAGGINADARAQRRAELEEALLGNPLYVARLRIKDALDILGTLAQTDLLPASGHGTPRARASIAARISPLAGNSWPVDPHHAPGCDVDLAPRADELQVSIDCDEIDVRAPAPEVGESSPDGELPEHPCSDDIASSSESVADTEVPDEGSLGVSGRDDEAEVAVSPAPAEVATAAAEQGLGVTAEPVPVLDPKVAQAVAGPPSDDVALNGAADNMADGPSASMQTLSDEEVESGSCDFDSGEADHLFAPIVADAEADDVPETLEARLLRLDRLSEGLLSRWTPPSDVASEAEGARDASSQAATSVPSEIAADLSPHDAGGSAAIADPGAIAVVGGGEHEDDLEAEVRIDPLPDRQPSGGIGRATRDEARALVAAQRAAEDFPIPDDDEAEIEIRPAAPLPVSENAARQSASRARPRAAPSQTPAEPTFDEAEVVIIRPRPGSPAHAPERDTGGSVLDFQPAASAPLNVVDVVGAAEAEVIIISDRTPHSGAAADDDAGAAARAAPRPEEAHVVIVTHREPAMPGTFGMARGRPASVPEAHGSAADASLGAEPSDAIRPAFDAAEYGAYRSSIEEAAVEIVHKANVSRIAITPLVPVAHDEASAGTGNRFLKALEGS